MKKRLITEEEKKKLLVEMLQKLDSIFLKNDITYFLAYGTLLGAVRHQGFIPWDDDVDLLLPRESFLRCIQLFEENCEEFKQNHLEIVEYGKNKKDYFKRFKIADTRTVMEEFGEERSAVFIDIFPLDCFSNASLTELRKKRKKVLMLDNLISLCHAGQAQGTGIKKMIYSVLLVIYNLFGRERCKQHLLKQLKQLTAFDVNGIVCASESGVGDKDYNKAVDWSENVRVVFEGETFNAPKGYHSILTTRYGDYMQLPPESDRHAHEYYEMYWR